MNIYSCRAKKYLPFLFVLIAFFVCSLTMFIYANGTLKGELDYHFLPAKMFGVPSELVAKGISPLYVGAGETGWDGQFYYYMSNDLLSLKDTKTHIDAPSYRYQRIGLSLFASFIAKITGQDWVSPKLYYFSYLSLVLCGVWAATRIMLMRGGWILAGLVWLLGAGTQVTLLNGLPDAAADAFLILSIYSYYSSRNFLSSLMLSMSVLSREGYVLFPVMLSIVIFYRNIQSKNAKNFRYILSVAFEMIRSKYFIVYALPILVFVVWQSYVRLHFGIAPSEQAYEIIGLPLLAFWKAFSSGISGHHYLVGAGFPSYFEGASLLCFIVIVITAISVSLRVLINNCKYDSFFVAISLAAVAMAFLYLCFGRTVMMHYTGYFKAANLYLFLIPLILTADCFSQRTRTTINVILLFALFITTTYLWKDRILVHNDSIYSSYTRSGEVKRITPEKCLDNYKVSMQLLGIEDLHAGYIPLFGTNHREQVFWVNVVNHTGKPFVALNGQGAVNFSYHWLSQDGSTVIVDGIRSVIPEGVADGASIKVPIVVRYPTSPGSYILKLSPVQEGCAWFYMANPDSVLSIQYLIR